ncbi:metal-dependent hydrolase family protein, partial [Croceicoccus bisphenolivorans]|uniref:metal-dependent hydrolase family protein n=1 Tax=Croceicoccus bisphenolivorans TaxID=1783232 RepID=UPI0009ECCA04
WSNFAPPFSELIENGSIIVEDGIIKEVASGEIKSDAKAVIDCAGKFLMPGLIDLHFHAYSASFDMHYLDTMPDAFLVSHAVRHLEGALDRGFTTVRDPGGGDIGLALAIEKNLINGPRFYYGGKALSQTGGHGDMRNPREKDLCNCAYSGVICQIVDGADEVRKVARGELHRGADHIKVFISGGVASPSDPIWMQQFTMDELQAAVEEARTRRKYVIAHCHTDDGARRCVEAGIRSIDHATSISPQTAELIAKTGNTYTVPTVAVIQQILTVGAESGMSAENREKAAGALESMLGSIETCRRAGVKVGLGTDVFGTDYHNMQSNEFRYRSEVESPLETLRSATSVNAEIMQRAGELGCIAPGARADMIVLDGNPLNDVSIFERYATHMPVVIKNGTVKRHQL